MLRKIKTKKQCTLLQNYYHGRIPFLTLGWRPGSLTVEAALVLPVFLFAMLTVVYIGSLIQCQDEVQWALTRVAREASAEYGASESRVMESLPYYQAKLRLYLGEKVVSAHLLESKILKEKDEIDLVVNYRAKTPFSRIKITGLHFRQRVCVRAFTGVEQREKEGKDQGELVYVTPTGRVYHRSQSCTYLKLSVSRVKYEDLQGLRNESGGRYRECEKCVNDTEKSRLGDVWITNYGDRYHTTGSCSGIKRTIQEISLEDVGTRVPCSKCGQ